MTKERNIFEILSILDRRSRALTSQEITDELQDLGIPLTDRMIRHYLQQLDKEDFTVNLGKQGRMITESGRDELEKMFISMRSNLVIDTIVRFATDTRFDVNRRRGEVIVNLSLIDEFQEQRVRDILAEVCSSNLFPQLIKISRPGEQLCNRKIPEGKIGLATVSSVTVDQILLNNGIYFIPLTAGLLEFIDHRPVRFTVVTPPSDISFDPLELFIQTRKTTVYDAVTKNCGEILVECEQVPYTARIRAIRLLEKTVEALGGLIAVGRTGIDLFGMKPRESYTGIITVCGESLPAALEECGINTETKTIASTINFKELEPIAPVRGEVLLL